MGNINEQIAKAEEDVDMSHDFRFVDPQMPWRNMKFTGCTAKPLQVKIFENGKTCIRAANP